jgi:ethanolamine ammonia-lyase small subunit
MKKELLLKDRLLDFSPYSHARVGLGHTGGQLRTTSWLDFQAGFAQAKDAVFSSFDTEKISELCRDLQLPNYIINSAVTDLLQFLTRPDLGGLLAEHDQQILATLINSHPEYLEQDLLIVISGGLSPIAIQEQIPELLPALITDLQSHHLSHAPIIINPRGRVALGDELNALFKAKMVAMLIGERPGLTTPDSLGIYFTYNAKPGCTNDMRNCISNIHARGLSASAAVSKLQQLICSAKAQKNHKDQSQNDKLQGVLPATYSNKV